MNLALQLLEKAQKKADFQAAFTIMQQKDGDHCSTIINECSEADQHPSEYVPEWDDPGDLQEPGTSESGLSCKFCYCILLFEDNVFVFYLKFYSFPIVA
jgi:hypothetical protein